MTAKIALLASTKATSIRASWDAMQKNILDAQVVCVVSNKADAPVLQWAQQCHIPTTALMPHAGEHRAQYDHRMMAHIDMYTPDMVLMVGYMRIVSPAFCRHYHNRLFNVHPSLLPAHAGLMDMAVHRSVLDSGDSTSGCTIHRVTPLVDRGQCVIQLACEVLPTDTPQTLKCRVQRLESKAWIQLLQDWKNYV